MNSNNEFRDNLLKQDELNFSCSDYRRNIESQLQKKLGPVIRAVYGLICLASTLSFLYFFNWAFLQSIGEGLIMAGMKVLSVIAVVLIGLFAFFTGWSAFTGKSRGYFYPGFVMISSVLGLIFFVVAASYFIFIAPITVEAATDYRSILSIQVMMILFFAVALIGIILTLRAVTEAKFQSQRKLLEIEYKLCTVLEQLEKMQSKRD